LLARRGHGGWGFRGELEAPRSLVKKHPAQFIYEGSPTRRGYEERIQEEDARRI
jgi:hypothetical protein